MSQFINISVEVAGSLEEVWNKFTQADHIVNWYFATPSWHAPSANIDFVEGGMFSIRMEAWDQSFGFDYSGKYDSIKTMQSIKYTLDDGRQVLTDFEDKDSTIRVSQRFEVEEENDAQMQKQGWQSILDSFKRYVETDFLIFESQIEIKGSKEALWSAITELDKYQKWTTAFSENAVFKGKWALNEFIDFITPDRGGTRVEVTALEPMKSICLNHVAIIKPNGDLDSSSDSALDWINTIENYYINEKNDALVFVAHMECHRSYYDFMKSSWDQALVDLKKLIESEN